MVVFLDLIIVYPIASNELNRREPNIEKALPKGKSFSKMNERMVIMGQSDK